MKDSLLKAGVIAVAGLFASGMIAISPAIAAENDMLAKREDAIAQIATVEDDDDLEGADTNTGSNSGFTSGVNSNDGTNSRHTNVSRDRDRSRGDLTKDWTRDGGDRTRDHSRYQTNDRSRNDTR